MKTIIISAFEPEQMKNGKFAPGIIPHDADFYTEMFKIKNGAYREVIEQCRKIEDKVERNNYKVEHLPALTISARCNGRRKTENGIHTGLLNLDIDSTGNEHIKNWEELRDEIFERPQVVCAFLSASGNGLSFVVKIRPEEHKDVFFSIVDECRDHLGIKVDAGLHDIVRLRFVSWDPNMPIREDIDAIAETRPSIAYLESRKVYGNVITTIEPVGERDSVHNFNEAVKRAETVYQFVDGQKHSYLVSVAGACNVMGMSKEYCKQMVLQFFSAKTNISKTELLKPIESVYKKYKDQHNTYKTRALSEKLNRGLTHLFITKYLHKGIKPDGNELSEIAKENDANIDRVKEVCERVWAEYPKEFGYNKFPLIDKVEIFLLKYANYFLNKVTGQQEQQNLGENEMHAINPDEIFRQLQHNSLKFSLNNIKSLLKSEFVKSYDPIERYFKQLPPWDGEDHIKKLSSYITCTDQEFWYMQFLKTLVRCIPCGLGKQENRIVLVLQGEKQETGKTFFIRYLNPWGVDRYYTESPVLGSGKDSEFKFSENFIYNLEELAALNSSDIEKLKAVISKRSIKERRAYATYEQESPRRCNFFASTNQDFFLQDFENTRWLVFNVKDINWAYLQEVDIHKVWAQAWLLYQNGFDYNLSKEERMKREDNNETFRIYSNEEELITAHYKPSSDAMANFYTASQIAGWLGNRYGIRLSNWKVGRALKKHFNLNRSNARIDNRVVHGYWLIRTDESLATDERLQNGMPKPPVNDF